LLTCKEFLQELSDYLDEAVDADVKAKLESHIALCPDCWVVCDTTKKTIQIYKGMDPVPIPAEIHTRLMSAVEQKIARKGPV